MENMIKRIIEADNEAKALEEKTLREKAKLSKSIDSEAEKIYDDYIRSANETVLKNNESEKLKADKQWEEIQQKHKSALIKLKADFEQNCDKWADEIAKRAIAQ